jgi:hypothetical protein
MLCLASPLDSQIKYDDEVVDNFIKSFCYVRSLKGLSDSLARSSVPTPPDVVLVLPAPPYVIAD